LADAAKKGDLVYVDYELWVVNPGGQEELYETTKADLAKENGIFNEKRVYSEHPVVLGQGRLMKGVEESLEGAPTGEPREALIPPEKGAGERDPKLVELHPLREFLKQEIDPHPGLEVSIRNRRGIVTSVTAGRVRVDLNNPLAGKTLRYRYVITRIAVTPEEKVRGVLDMDYGFPGDFQVTVSDSTAEIQLPDLCKTDEKWFVAKFRVVSDLREVASIESVKFVEEYRKPAEKKETKPEAAEVKAPEERVEEEIPPEEREAAPEIPTQGSEAGF
jgi:FKBP-type peptidyl-prolyl cis-trans isomerase 2